jgi:hypothetical protein
MESNVEREVKEVVKKKENYIAKFIKSMAAIEFEIQPYKEQLKDLKTNYIENEWLSKEELRMAIKAYRLLKVDTDMDQLMDFYEHVNKTMKGV